MHLAMMTTAERNRELIADLAVEGRRLCKTDMMRIGGTPAANQAWLLGDRFPCSRSRIRRGQATSTSFC